MKLFYCTTKYQVVRDCTTMTSRNSLFVLQKNGLFEAASVKKLVNCTFSSLQNFVHLQNWWSNDLRSEKNDVHHSRKWLEIDFGTLSRVVTYLWSFNSQCANSRIFLPPRFYVKSILGHWELQDRAYHFFTKNWFHGKIE